MGPRARLGSVRLHDCLPLLQTPEVFGHGSEGLRLVHRSPPWRYLCYFYLLVLFYGIYIFILFSSFVNMSVDHVPLWDFAATDGIKDSSAASIAASGLIELSTYVASTNATASKYLLFILWLLFVFLLSIRHVCFVSLLHHYCFLRCFDSSRKYITAANSILGSLSSPNYLADPAYPLLFYFLSLSVLFFPSPSFSSLLPLALSSFLVFLNKYLTSKRKSEAILLQGTGGQGSLMNCSLIFGDYYYVEALIKSLKL